MVADFYPLLKRAVEGRPQAEREALYARARMALERQLRALDPPISEGDFSEQLAGFEGVIDRLELESLAVERLVADPQAQARAYTEAPAEPPSLAQSSLAQSSLEQPFPPSARPPSLPEQKPQEAPAPLAEPEPVSQDALAAMALAESASVEPSRPRAVLRTDTARARRNRLLYVASALLIMIVAAVVALSRRGANIAELARPAQQSAAIQPNAVDRTKTEGRLNSADTAGVPAPKPPSEGPSRSYMIVEVPGQSPSQFEGVTDWRFEPDPAQGGEKILRARLNFAKPGIAVEMTLSRNNDRKMPYSHLLMVVFETGEGSTPVRAISGIEWREREAQAGGIMSGANVPVQDNVFVIGLENTPEARARHLDMMKTQKWLVFEFVLASGRRGAVLAEKGSAGEKAILAAIEAWK